MSSTSGNRKLLIFRTVLLLTPVLFFLLLELLLRLFHYGGSMDLFEPWEWKGKRYMKVNAGVANRYFGRKGFSPYVSRDVFLAEKRANTVRIFCLGESTTIGFPYMFNGSFSSLLRDRLADLHPDKEIEMVNVGVTAVNSYTVADFTREIMDYEPDLLIVYAGHNEFYGAMGVGSTESGSASRLAVRLYLALRSVRTVQLIRDLTGAAASWFGGQQRFETGQTLMEQVVRDRYIQYRAEEYELAREEFRRNLTSVVETARDGHVPLLLCTLVSNLHDQYPFVSMFSERSTQQVRDQWNQFYLEGVGQQEAGEILDALGSFAHAALLDSNRADLHYRVAQCFEQQGRLTESLQEYRKAKDLDGLRFRASEDFNETIREVASLHAVPVVEMEKAFMKNSPGGIPGSTLFWEHLHPRLRGYSLMAAEFCSAMAEQNLIRPRSEWQWTLAQSDSVYMAAAGVTALDEEVARVRMEFLLARWPFRDPPRPFEYHPETLLQQTAWDYLQSRIGWATAHDRMGGAYMKSKNWAAAELEYMAIAKCSAYDPHYFDLAGDLQAAQGQFGEAAKTFRRSLQIENSPITCAKLGETLLRLRDPAGATTQLEAALQTDAASSAKLSIPQRIRTITLLANASLMQNRTEDAERRLQDLLAIAPDAPETKALQTVMAHRRQLKK